MRFGPACGHCIHKLKSGGLDGEGWACRAFPDGIPSDVVLSDEIRHDKHLPDDNGFKYDPKVMEDDGIRFVFDWDGAPVILDQ